MLGDLLRATAGIKTTVSPPPTGCDAYAINKPVLLYARDALSAPRTPATGDDCLAVSVTELRPTRRRNPDRCDGQETPLCARSGRLRRRRLPDVALLPRGVRLRPHPNDGLCRNRDSVHGRIRFLFLAAGGAENLTKGAGGRWRVASGKWQVASLSAFVIRHLSFVVRHLSLRFALIFVLC